MMMMMMMMMMMTTTQYTDKFYVFSCVCHHTLSTRYSARN